MLKFFIALSVVLTISRFKSKYFWAIIVSNLFFLRVLILVFFPVGLNYFSSISFFFIDGLSLPLVILTLWISGLMLISRYKIFLNKENFVFFRFNLILLNNILILCFLSKRLILFYILFESSLFPTIIIILVWGYQPERLQASLYFIIYTVTASLPLLVRITLVFYSNFSLAIQINLWVSPVLGFTEGVWWVITIIAFIVKLPLYSVHLWLPKAHVEAPVAGSIILAAILLKLGSYGLIRISYLIPFINLKLVPMFRSLCIIGACVTRIICLRQPDVKSIIAYSSVGHIGFVIIGILSCSSWGWSGSLGLIVSHGLCSSALFSLANIVYEFIGSRRLLLVKGLIIIFPSIRIWWFLLCVANISGPPSFNLFSEILLLGAVLIRSFFFSFFFVLSRFLVGAFRLVLYTSTQHGRISNYINPIGYRFIRNHIIIFLHIFPLYFLLLHPYGFFFGL